MNEPTAAAPAPHRSSMLKQVVSVLIALIIGGLLAFGAYLYWNYQRTHPSTDDGYLQAHYVWIGPRVDAQVVEVPIVNHQRVEAGQLLFKLDPAPFEAALKKATAAARLVQQDIEVQRAAVSVAEAKVREQRALLNNAKENFERISKLVKRGDEPALKGIEVKDQYEAAQATLDDLRAELDLAQQTLGPEVVRQARIGEAEAEVAIARLNLDWTQVKAPAAGWIGRLTLRPGDQVEAGDKLFTLIEEGDWWVQANYKETAVAGIREGMPARVRIDSYSDRVFSGRVRHIGAASAAAFSLLPAQNTTGNWVKVTQRIPVRIGIEPMDSAMPYRFGASARVTVDIESPADGGSAPAGAAGSDQSEG